MATYQEKYYITFGGNSIADLGCYILEPGIFSAPERDVTVHEVPGRNGDIVIDNGRWRNITATYRIVVPFNKETGFLEQFNKLKAMLCGQIGYQELRDTYRPDEYRKAYVSGQMATEISTPNQGVVTVTFNCMPQRFLGTGENAIMGGTAYGSALDMSLHDKSELRGNSASYAYKFTDGIVVIYPGMVGTLHLKYSSQAVRSYMVASSNPTASAVSPSKIVTRAFGTEFELEVTDASDYFVFDRPKDVWFAASETGVTYSPFPLRIFIKTNDSVEGIHYAFTFPLALSDFDKFIFKIGESTVIYHGKRSRDSVVFDSEFLTFTTDGEDITADFELIGDDFSIPPGVNSFRALRTSANMSIIPRWWSI